MDGEEEHIVGLLMVDRPVKAGREWLDEVEKAFGSYQLLPMTLDGDRGILCSMKIKRESREYVRELPSDLSENLSDALSPLLKYRPNPRFRVWWDEDCRLWLSEFDI